nr:PREDICTED: uncharacterized protein LOC100880405 isoform X1 [Megachile rotundata]
MDYKDETFGVSYFKAVWASIASVGWYIVAIFVCCWYASPYIQEKYRKWKLRIDERDYAAKYHKDPDLLQERLSALEASRQRMQEKYYEKCVLARQEEKEKEIKREAARLIDNAFAGQRLGNSSRDESTFVQKNKKSLKGDYNPLMGDNSRGYRPPKRTCCGKGGCG